MLLAIADDDQLSVLGALGSVCTADGPLSDAGAEAITSFAELGLGASGPDPARLPSTTPEQLAAALSDDVAAATIIEVLAVAALVDGELNRPRIDRVLEFPGALGSDRHWLGDLALSKQDDLSPVIADMGDRNLRSVTDGRLDLAHIDDINHWLMPYDGDGADVGLADRYRALAQLPAGSLDEFWPFYDRHHFVFPGEPGAVNEMFATPHDCTHLLSGYDTTPQGELLVSTFTARMHPVFPMEGHILPVIYSWHSGSTSASSPVATAAPSTRPSSGSPGDAGSHRCRHLRSGIRLLGVGGGAARRPAGGRRRPAARGGPRRHQ